MAFEPGFSGNPGGRPSSQPFRAAIIREIEKAGRDPVKLDKIAAKLLAKAEQGDLTAIGMIADRLDGKAHQAITNDTTYRLTVERVERQIIEPGRLLRTDELPKLVDIATQQLPSAACDGDTASVINEIASTDTC